MEFRATPAKTIIYSTSTAVTMTPSRGKKTFAAARNAPEAHALFELSRKRFPNSLADDDREGEPQDRFPLFPGEIAHAEGDVHPRDV